MIKNDGYGCSPNPYEEGTESHYQKSIRSRVHNAAAQIPMKRELKVAAWEHTKNLKVLSCSPNPYEEGTESDPNPYPQSPYFT